LRKVKCIVSVQRAAEVTRTGRNHHQSTQARPGREEHGSTGGRSSYRRFKRGKLQFESWKPKHRQGKRAALLIVDC